MNRPDTARERYVSSVNVSTMENGIKTKDKSGKEITREVTNAYDMTLYSLLANDPGAIVSMNLSDEDERDYISSYLYDNKGRIIRWNLVTDGNHRVINCNNQGSLYSSDGNAIEASYMYMQYSDNWLDDPAEWTGSFFGGDMEWLIVIVGFAALAAGAGIYLFRKKCSKCQQSNCSDISI